VSNKMTIPIEFDTIYTGRYAENVAYNPSMSPIESALAYMNMSLPAQANEYYRHFTC
jgi:cytidine deaminase